MNNDDKIKWDSKKHDDKLAKRKENELEQQQRRYMKIIGEKYKAWKMKIRAKSRSQTELIMEIHRFQTSIDEQLWKCPESYRNTTLEIIEDILARVVATSGGRYGSIHQFVPEGLDAIPATVQFNTPEELEAIPFVKAFMDQNEFLGFCTDRNRLVAVYGSKSGRNEMPIVGSVIIPKKIRKKFKYPLLTELAQAISEKINHNN